MIGFITIIMKPIKLFVAAKACMVNKENKLLLLRESTLYKDGTNVAKYDVPGGRIEVSEFLEDALKREVFEEAGISVTGAEIFDVQDTFTEKGEEVWHIVRLFYKVPYSGEKIILSEDHDEYQWVDLHEVKDYPGLIPNLIPVLAKLV